MTAIHPTPAGMFPYFYNNQAIAELAHHRRWSVSDNNGRPLDIVALTLTGEVVGASPEHFDNSLVTLSELSHKLPQAANCAYHTSVARDGVLVFDIEKTCPPEIALGLLRSLPHTYAEVSRSGRGYHLIVPIPDDDKLHARLVDTPTTALRAEDGIYEILVEHWVTFTRNPITQEHLEDLTRRAHAAGNDIIETDLNTVLTDLLDRYDRPRLQFGDSATVGNTDIDTARSAPLYDEILAHMVAHPFDRDLDDYDHDHSRYEFAVMNWFYREFITAASTLGRVNDYDSSVRAVAIFDACTETIAPRDKHDTYRSGMPYLLYSATRCVSLR